MISIWSGSAAAVPAGWHLCDGSAGTPDLRDRFVLGAAGGYLPLSTGGAATHFHDFDGDNHNHQAISAAGIAANFPGGPFGIPVDMATDSGTTDTGPSLPPYYALAYIQFKGY